MGDTFTVGTGKTYATITAAIAAAAANNGDIIEVYAGTYAAEQVNATDGNQYLYISKAGLTFRAMGAVIVRAGSEATTRTIRIANASNSTVFDCGTGGSWTIDGFKADGTTPRTSAGLEVNSTVTGLSVTGMTVQGRANLSAGDSAFTNCTFTDNGNSIGNNGVVTTDAVAHTGVFTGCAFTTTHTSTAYMAKIEATSGTLTFTSCTFTGGCATNAIHVGASANLVVDQCTFTMNLVATDSIINVTENGTNGAVTITDNTINASVLMADRWIDVRSTTDGVYHAVIIRGNQITGTATTAATTSTSVIYLVNQQGAVVSGNTIITAATTGTFKHIFINANGDADSNASGAVVSYNTCKHAHHEGHVICVGTDGYAAANAGYCDTATIEGNTIIYTGSVAYASRSVHAILFAFSKQATIKGNYVEGAGIGIGVKSGGSALQDWDATGGVIGNTLVNCSGLGGIVVKASVDVVVEYNTIYVAPECKVATRCLLRAIENPEAADGFGDCAGLIFRYNTIYAPSGMYCLYVGEDQVVASLLDNKFYTTGSTATTGYMAALAGVAKTWPQLLAVYATAGSYLASDTAAKATGALNRVTAEGSGDGSEPRWRMAGTATF
jgi:co-chaperonin GroES (HSP10)